ncbi:chromatin-remodeling complex subunit ies6, partial [Tulasnella sp. 427]
SVQANMTEQPIKQEVPVEFKRSPPQPTARLLTPPSDSPSPTEKHSIKASKRPLEKIAHIVENMDPPTNGAPTQSSGRSTNFMFTMINPDSASAPLSPLHSRTEPAVPLAASFPPQPSLLTRQKAPSRNVTFATETDTTTGSVILEGEIGISLRATEDGDKERQSKRRKVLDVMIPPSRRSPLATRKLGPTSRSPESTTVQSRLPLKGALTLINYVPSIIPVPTEDPMPSDYRERKAHRRAQKELERKLSAQLEVANPTYFRPCEQHVLDHGQRKAMERDLKRARDGEKKVKTESPEVPPKKSKTKAPPPPPPPKAAPVEAPPPLSNNHEVLLNLRSQAEQHSFAATPRPFKNMASKNATGPRKAKAVKIMLLAERDRELAEVKHLRKKREKALAEKRKGQAEAMDIDQQEENEAKEGAAAPLEEEPLICYSTIEAPPSLIPATRYCDITGLEAPYTDPLTGLRYHDKDVFAHIRTLKPSAVQSYLSLRGGGQPVIV